MAKTNYRGKIKVYLDDLSKKGYQPGGGSAGALAFCLGVSLFIKSIRHSAGKNIGKNKKNKLERRLDKLLFFKKKVFFYIDKDGEIFAEAMGSKGRARQKKLKEAEKLLKDLACLCGKVFLLAKEIEADIKKGLESDFCLGLEFIKISKLSALANLEANNEMFKKRNGKNNKCS